MARERRQFKGSAKACLLGSDITATATTITLVGDYSGWPDGSTGKFPIVIDRGGTQEAALGNTRSGGTVTLASSADRGVDDTTAAQHTANVSVEHGSIRRDYDEANELVAAVALNSVRVYSTAAIGMAHNTAAAIPFNTERFDGNTMHSTSFTTSRLTCRVAGKYYIYAHVQWVGNATGIRQIAITLNGTTDIAASTVAPNGTQSMSQSLGTVYSLAANDYVEVTALQDSGGLLNIYAAGNFSSEFGMQFVGF